jgi:hypothetical protein
LCCFSNEQYGLGVDVESEIIKNPDLVDLMITMCFAACNATSSNFNPFDPYPAGIEVSVIEKEKTKVYNFKRDDKNDNSKVKNVISTYPKVEKLQDWVKNGVLKDEMFKLHPLAFPLLR